MYQMVKIKSSWDYLVYHYVYHLKSGLNFSPLSILHEKMIQSNLFLPESKNNERLLMDMIDNVNLSMRDDMIKFAASGMKRNWKMQQNFHSGRYTTRWDEVFEVS